jgi:hypothetical protein
MRLAGNSMRLEAEQEKDPYRVQSNHPLSGWLVISLKKSYRALRLSGNAYL